MSLPTLSSKRLFDGVATSHQPGDGDLVAYCDPHDLIAIATEAHDIIVYRITGQIAFTIKRKDDDLVVTALSWKEDGSVLAVAWSDGSWGLHSGENGKSLHRSSVRSEDHGSEREWRLDLVPDFGGGDDDEQESRTNVVHFEWRKHVGDEGSAVGDLSAELSTEDWEDMFDSALEFDGLHQVQKRTNSKSSVKRLARAIATMDATTVLPKLSAIPSHGLRAGPDGSKFSTQALVDTIFGVAKTEDTGFVDTLVITCSDGIVRVMIDDTVEIGSCTVPGMLVLSASHTQSPTHTLISRSGKGETVVSLLDIALHALSSTLLHEVSTNTKRIQHLLEYIAQTIRCIEHDYTTGLQFPSRLRKNIIMELEEKQEGDLVSNMYHLAMTGQYSPTMLEWLSDIVKETNHKRWDVAITTMYTNILNHVFFNLLPALTRLEIAITTLRGHAIHHAGSNNSHFAVEPKLFTNLLEGADSLRLVAQKLQLVVAAELKQFKAFSKWLKVYIDVAIAEPGTAAAIEIEEREQPNLEMGFVLGYVEDILMTGSKIEGFVLPLAEWRGGYAREEWVKRTEVMSYERVMHFLQVMGSGKEVAPVAQISLPALAAWTHGSARMVLQRITAWQSKLLKAPMSQSIAARDNDRMLDLRMLSVGGNSGASTTTQLLLLPEADSRALLIQNLSNPSSKAQAFDSEVCAMDGRISDAKATPDGTVLVLIRRDDDSIAIVTKENEVVHAFDPDFEAQRILLGGRQGKSVCFVLGERQGGREWRLLDLEAAKLGMP
ncbi:hypothetical protein LTR78_001134 [Recurvomyces mirabilis]|uniref:Anaphase-promoting complex subunit 4 n=1 Tax=Recurvomyces mirabilis TaxID=574656 RepID=A0AAE0WW91_9PEZI|nr:hypothetical protein LTR78_001134 [Recurvomyces mirabilis]KAK5161110.1 hypothetical protein LTS14_000906 [Recurvomyces mirabilis]